VEQRRDAVRDRLPITFMQRNVDGKHRGRTRQHLPLKRVAVDIDDTGQYQQTIRIETRGI